MFPRRRREYHPLSDAAHCDGLPEDQALLVGGE